MAAAAASDAQPLWRRSAPWESCSRNRRRSEPGTRGEAWIEAAVSGLLLHVVTHDWAHEHDSPALPGWPQVIAIAAGVSVLLLGR